MKKIVAPLLIVFVGVWYLLFNVSLIEAKTGTIMPTLVASQSASPSATLAPTAVSAPKLTENDNRKVDYVVEKWNGINSFKWIIKLAISRGVATNTIVLLLLLPLVATLVSFLHYIVGLSGYGIFMPTMIAITFVATGVFGGLLLFAIILTISLISNMFLKKLKIHFWPARAISLMFISLGTFGLMLLTSFVKIIDISQISIFPILFMILLVEEFTRTQLAKSKKEAKSLTIGTIILAIIGAVTMNFGWVQNIVLNHPGTSLILVLVANLLIGNYSGIRLTEIKRFKKAIREKKKSL